jgi:hypothetical protein
MPIRSLKLLAASAILIFMGRGQTQKPLPDPKELLHRARLSLLQSEKDLEKYSCTVLEKNQELNDNNNVKKEHSTLKERFYVNGIQLEHVLAKDGVPLSGRSERKEQEHVNKDVTRFSDQRPPVRLTGRARKSARSCVLFDLPADAAKPETTVPSSCTISPATLLIIPIRWRSASHKH